MSPGSVWPGCVDFCWRLLFTGRIRAMAKDFQRAMDDAAEESGMSDLKRDLSNVSKYTNPKSFISQYFIQESKTKFLKSWI